MLRSVSGDFTQLDRATWASLSAASTAEGVRCPPPSESPAVAPPGTTWSARSCGPGSGPTIKAHRVAQAAERLAAGVEWFRSGLVFAQPNGKPIDPRSDHREWQDILTEAEVRRARLHDARHTAATIMLTMGVPARVAMEILGHSQISLTLGTYGHVVPELAQDAAKKVGTAMWGS